jgi:hypothetical protein
MSQMLPTLRLTSAGLDEHLGGLSLASGLAASREVAAFDVAISDIKVSSMTALPSTLSSRCADLRRYVEGAADHLLHACHTSDVRVNL